MASAQLDRVLFMPAGDPWQKSDRLVTSKEHRLAMVALALVDAPGFELDRREVDRDGPTYTIDTLNSFPDEDDLFLILGADAASGLNTWHRHHEVLDRAGVLVVPRPGSDAAEVVDGVPGARLLDMAALDVSSTMIRSMARQGLPFRYLVPGAVHRYIMEQNLYANQGNGDSVGETTETETSS